MHQPVSYPASSIGTIVPGQGDDTCLLKNIEAGGYTVAAMLPCANQSEFDVLTTQVATVIEDTVQEVEIAIP